MSLINLQSHWGTGKRYGWPSDLTDQLVSQKHNQKEWTF